MLKKIGVTNHCYSNTGFYDSPHVYGGRVTVKCPFISTCRTPFSIPPGVGIMMAIFLSFYLTGNVLVCVSLLKGSFAGGSILGWHFYSFSNLNTLAHCFLASRVSDKKSDNLIEEPLWLVNYVTSCFSFATFKILLLCRHAL